MKYAKTEEAIARLTPEQFRVTQEAALNIPVLANMSTTRSRAFMLILSLANHYLPHQTNLIQAAAGQVLPSQS